MPTTKPVIKKAYEVGAASVRKLDEQEEWRSTCGMRRDLVEVGKSEPLWFHYMRISDSMRHAHARQTEYYFVVEGVGEMELDGEVVAIEKGDMIVVPPGVKHTSRPTTDAELHILITVLPQPSGEPEEELILD